MTKPRKTKSLKYALMSMFLLLGAAVVASPASAATNGLHQVDSAALAMVIAFGALLFAIVFEVWRMTLRKSVPIRTRTRFDWSDQDH